MTKQNWACIAVFVVFGQIAAADEAGEFDWTCVTSLELPTHGLSAAHSEQSGVVHARVRIGEQGEGSVVEITRENLRLEAEVRVAIEVSRFSPRCKDRVLNLVFSFILVDPPRDERIPPRVQFIPPNRFELTFRKLKKFLDPPDEPLKK